jgi:Xaa-Pro aminopeptidase
MMLVSRRAATFYTDFRYQKQIRTEVKGCRKRVLKRDLYAYFPVEDLRGIRRLGVEQDNITVGRFRLLRRQAKRVRLVPVSDHVRRLRRTKEPTEIALIAKAQAITDRVFGRILDRVRPGVSERDLALELEFQFKRQGEVAFPSIVASGPNAAKPHAGHTTRKLRRGDVITFDIGCQYCGYCSDMTRTVFLGRPDPVLREVYAIVHEAQHRALAALKPGVAASDVDAAARGYIRDLGYDRHFGHSLGHGVGLEVHEMPGMASTTKGKLQPGDVVTVEPGIYLPGLGGVRIEDMVVVTKSGYRNLTRSQKRMLVL